MKPKIVLLNLLLITLISCEKKDNEIDKFDMVYEMILTRDESVMAITGYTNTYFPDEDITAINDKIKCNCYDADDKSFLKSIDTLTIIPKYKVYSGCERAIDIRIQFKIMNNIVRYRDYHFGNLVINSKEDANFKFIWPEDSAHYEYKEISYPAHP